MSDFLNRLAEEGAPIARELTVDGEKGTVYFRRITAGQREMIVKGMKVSYNKDSGSSVDIDLAENERQRHMMVLYSVCHENGKRYFSDLKEVKNMPSNVVTALAATAGEINQDDGDEDPGKV